MSSLFWSAEDQQYHTYPDGDVASHSEIRREIQHVFDMGVKRTIAHFKRMNIEDPKAPVNLDEVERRALAQRNKDAK